MTTPIEAYIQKSPADRQELLTELYHFIKELVPQAEEKISYGMPTFYLNGNLVHFANASKHIGFYPTPSAVSAFQEDLTGYKTSKGAIQFPVNKELPWEVIKKIVLFRIKENTEAI
ncbi:iron chaperone [Enterococcus sp. LJL128]|uniref:iron chaperone n=1 Tax=Enterococcus sp. LJL51 TaxID=3416656 RepID=UPI003CF3CC26